MDEQKENNILAPLKGLKSRLLLVSLFTIFGLAVLFSFIFLSPKLPLEPKSKISDNEISVLIREGLNVKQIGEILEQQGLFLKDDFITEANDAEGYLFPDTYRFFRTSSPGEIVEKMKKNFDLKLAQIIEDIKKGDKPLEDIIIMASIIEKEVAHPEDRRLVSGILWKRNNIGMALQVDATLDYILGKASHELTESDLKHDSPYNTYLYAGLPPGPIANPGLDSILAAMSPEPSIYFYYLSDDDGNIHYAATFEQHKENKFKYLR